MGLKLEEEQIHKLADIASDTGLVALGSVVLPAVFDRMDVMRMAIGFIATILLWLTSIWLIKLRN